MRLNFTGRRKIDKQHAGVALNDDPPGGKSRYYFELSLKLDSYQLPSTARVFIEAYRGPTLVRFDLGTVGTPTTGSPDQRRLAEFGPNPDGVKFRLKVTQPDGHDAGKLLAEADGLVPSDGGGVFPLIRLAGGDLGATPWRLELVATDPDLPTLFIHNALGGKEYAKDPIAKPLLLTAAAREVFASLVRAGDHEDEPEHWASLWAQFATEILGISKPPEDSGDNDDEVREWIDVAVDAFAAKHELATSLAEYRASFEQQQIEDAI